MTTTKIDCSLCGGDGWTDSSAELRRDGQTGNTTCIACNGTGKETVTTKKTPCPKHASTKYGPARYVHLCAECRALNPDQFKPIRHSGRNL
jgi:hypothetical protein